MHPLRPGPAVHPLAGPGWLQAISKVSPLSYEVSALRGLLIGLPANLALDFGVLAGATTAAIIVASLLLSRLAR